MLSIGNWLDSENLTRVTNVKKNANNVQAAIVHVKNVNDNWGCG